MSKGEKCMEQRGVWVVLCCHNSAGRLPLTLAHLAAQQISPKLAWEVIVVDNASNDGTAEVAMKAWPEDAPVKLHVVHESQLGLSNARWRGFSQARYEVVSFIDDDNWCRPPLGGDSSHNNV